MAQRLIWILWPGFVMSIAAVGIVFTLVDPADLHVYGAPLDLSDTGVYTTGFLLFWLLGSGCSALTCLLQRSPFEINRCPLTLESRPDGCPKQGPSACGR